MKIAPTLQHFVERHSNDAPAWVEGARRELRALLAVARTARASSCGRVEHPPTPLNRALARLERVSRVKP